MRLLHTRFIILCRPYHSFDRVLEHEIRDLVARYEVAGESTAVNCDDADLF